MVEVLYHIDGKVGFEWKVKWKFILTGGGDWATGRPGDRVTKIY